MLHKHRLVPGHMGGTYANTDNVVLMTVDQHADAHRVLWEEHGRWQDYCAWQALSGQIGKDDIYRMCAKQSGVKRRGRKASPESAMKRSASLTGKPRKPFSEAHRRHLSEAHRGQTPWNKGKQCPTIAASKVGNQYWRHRKPRIQQRKEANG